MFNIKNYNMQTIKNITTTMQGADTKLTYGDLIQLCIDNTPQGWFSVTEMRIRLRILDVIKKWWDKLKFEDEDYKTVKKCVSDMKWWVIHKDIIDFTDLILKNADWNA